MSARRIRVLYFAAVRELVGIDTEELSLPEAVRTVADLAAFLAGHHTALAPYLASVRFAVNEEFAQPEDALADGAAVALIPPVAGG